MERTEILKDDVYVITLGTRLNYFSQRNNKISSLEACNVTSMVMALEILGYSFPNIYPEYSQPEDKLIKFLRENNKVLKFYQKINPQYYREWKEGKKDSYPPNEVHEVLSYGTNLFMGKTVTKFDYNFPLNYLVREIINNKPVVMSGKFGGLNHIITLVGVEIYKESFENKEKEKLILDDVKNFIFNDPYGETYNYNSGKNGYNVRISKNRLATDFKSLDNLTKKWCHTFV